MKLIVSDEAAHLIEEGGGRLYVWVKKGRCCGAVRTLATSTEAPARQEFRRIEGDERFELFLPARLDPPDELQLDARRYPRRVEAYWNGCVWVV